MKMALVESLKALPKCRPNPPVGCVIVINNEVVAKGFTQEIGGMHAEAHALSKFKANLENAVVYVTLEPCSFVGRTPSCANALIDRKISKLYVSVRDTDPRNNGKGVSMLVSAGVEVIEGVLANDVSEFIGKYLIDN